MKPVLLLLASLALLVLVFLSGVIITAHVIAEPEPHRFAHMDTPDLWTSQPKPVDTSKQAYERLPPATAAAATDAPAAGVDVDRTATASISPQPSTVAAPPPSDMDHPGQPASTVNAVHAQWCYARYRSYRIEDNSYQPYDGGPRRQCRPPDALAAEDAATKRPQPVQNELQATEEPRTPAGIMDARNRDAGYAGSPVADDGAPVGAHEEWCFARYRSYRVEDNSYQPFRGGSRRQCRSPYG